MDVNEDSLNKIADFVLKYAPQYKDREKIKEYVRLHLLYKTIFIGYDHSGDVSYVCRWNANGSIAHVLDFYVREDYRNHKLIQLLLTQALWNNPELKYITFEREKKYPERKQRMYSIARILKQENRIA